MFVQDFPMIIEILPDEPSADALALLTTDEPTTTTSFAFEPDCLIFPVEPVEGLKLHFGKQLVVVKGRRTQDATLILECELVVDYRCAYSLDARADRRSKMLDQIQEFFELHGGHKTHS